MFLLARCQLPEPCAVQLARPQHRRRALAFRLWGRLCKARPCHFSLRKSTPVTQGAISWPLLVIRLIERGWHVWGPGMTGLCLRWREDFWLAVAMCVKWVLKFVCVCVCFACVLVCASGSVCGIILENLSLWRGTDVDLHMWRVPSLWWD